MLITGLIIGYFLVKIATGLYEHHGGRRHFEGFLVIAFFVLDAYGSVRNNKICLLNSGLALLAAFTGANSDTCESRMDHGIWYYVKFSPLPILAQAGLLQLQEEGIQRSCARKITLTAN